MKRLLLVGLVLVLPAVAAAQPVPACPDCVLGLWDDPALTSNYGTVTAGTMKDIYLGIKLGAGENGISGLEFSIYGMRNDTDGVIVTGTEWTTMPALTIGSTTSAPADSSAASTGTGGLNVGWTGCLTPTAGTNLNLARISFLTFTPLSNKIFSVLHKFPVSNTRWTGSPIFTRCNPPAYTAVIPARGCYVANWDGTTVLSCAPKVPVAPTTWSTVKRLFD
jgi:hypothetical protein